MRRSDRLHVGYDHECGYLHLDLAFFTHTDRSSMKPMLSAVLSQLCIQSRRPDSNLRPKACIRESILVRGLSLGQSCPHAGASQAASTAASSSFQKMAGSVKAAKTNPARKAKSPGVQGAVQSSTGGGELEPNRAVISEGEHALLSLP